MNQPDEIDPRLVKLAQRLLQQTRSGRTTWKRTDDPGRFLYAARTGSVIIERNLATGLYTLRVFDRTGNEQETLVAGLVMGSISFADAYGTLFSLFEAADASVRRGSALIDELIAEIG